MLKKITPTCISLFVFFLGYIMVPLLLWPISLLIEEMFANIGVNSVLIAFCIVGPLYSLIAASPVLWQMHKNKTMKRFTKVSCGIAIVFVYTALLLLSIISFDKPPIPADYRPTP